MTDENQPQTQVEERMEEREPEAQAEPDGESEADAEQVIAAQEGELVTEEEPDEVTVLSAQLAEAQSKADEYLDGWQRARAEFANYRRREEQRRKQMECESVGRVLRPLLPVMDDLERAFAAVPKEAQDSSWVEGLSLVGQKLTGALESNGLSVLPVQPGDGFDPNRHEAVLYEPSPDYGEGEIVEVLQQGYLLNETILRPAMVRVSSGKVEADDTADP